MPTEKFKVGDEVKVIEMVEDDAKFEFQKGYETKITRLSEHSECVYIKTPNGHEDRIMNINQLELIKKSPLSSFVNRAFRGHRFRIGDKVRIHSKSVGWSLDQVLSGDIKGIQTVKEIVGDPYSNEPNEDNYVNVSGNYYAPCDLELMSFVGKRVGKLEWPPARIVHPNMGMDFFESPPFKPQKKNIMQKLTAYLKRQLDAPTKKLYEAGLIDGKLELTEMGFEELHTILFFANKVELVKRAEEIIAEEKKKKDK